ncbi:MAG: PspC domain-containing protein [Bacteroidales bacterium]|nr:PspC domain-containing protein [Bacteroidales bacterium]
MEEIYRVSIGGVSFSVNKEAYAKLNTYLSELSAYYSKRKEESEILGDIETRIAELLLDSHTKEDVVTLPRVEKVISIMGNPSEIDDDSFSFSDDYTEQERGSASNEQSGSKTYGQSASEPVRKKMYRDPHNRILGGVLSGLSHYFKIDATILRFVTALLFFLPAIGIWGYHWLGGHGTFRIFSNMSSIIFVFYIILWIVMPSARTFTQRCAMKGENPGLKGVEDEYNNPEPVRGRWFGRLIKLFFGVVFVMIAIGLIVGGIAIYQSELWSGEYIDYLQSFYLANASQPIQWLYRLSFLLLWFLPTLAILVCGIRWIFNLPRMKRVYGLVNFFLWIAALICFVIISSAVIGNVEYNTKRKSKIEKELNKHYDTLYVNFAALPATFNGETAEWRELNSVIKYSYNYSVFDYYSDDYDEIEANAEDYVGGNAKDVVADSGENDVVALSDGEHYNHSVVRYVSGEKRRNRVFARYPDFRLGYMESRMVTDDDKIVRDTSLRASVTVEVTPVLRYKKKGGNAIVDEGIESSEQVITIKDSLITINPMFASLKNRGKGVRVNTKLTIPDSCVVIIDNSALKNRQ